MKPVKEMVLPEFGRRLASARSRAGLSQEALGRRVGASQPTVARWESGEHSPDLTTFLALCQALDTAPLYLLTGEGRERYMPVDPDASERTLAEMRRLLLEGEPRPEAPAGPLTREELDEVAERLQPPEEPADEHSRL